MKYKIIHETTYNFSTPVFFEPHYIRLKPQASPLKTLASFRVSIKPEPVGITELLDKENNIVQHCWFEEIHKQLRIHVESDVEIEPINLFNILLHPPSFQKLPFRYDDASINILQTALSTFILSAELIEYGEKLKKESNYNTLPFLLKLTQQIHSDFTIKSREIGNPHKPDTTFSLKSGSCRDVAWMQIHLLRNMGIASRFVSGYFYVNEQNTEFDLHAWIEVFLPGAGWIGCDPSNGLMAGQFHIPVSKSVNYENTMPVEGTIRGDASSELITRIQITEIE